MEHFLSCDWGTSAFRLRLVRVADLQILAEVTDGEGIADCFRRWKEQHALIRSDFYGAELRRKIDILSVKIGQSIAGIPIVLSGMASSTIGFLELPYKEVPFKLDGSDLLIKTLDTDGEHPIIIASGTRTDRDVMRGEETKVLGWAGASDAHDHLLILPGTHSKHITVRDYQVVGFQTHMTGEFFDLLANRSVLSASVTAGGDFEDPSNQACFSEGVLAGRTLGLLHAAFMVRTNQLLKGLSGSSNFYYLSGLLIGAELKDIAPHTSVCLVSGHTHEALYTKALQLIDQPVGMHLDADAALVRGQKVILDRYYRDRV